MDGGYTKPRVFLFSQRNHRRIMPYLCPHFEFEDIISEIDSVKMLAPRLDLSDRRHVIAKQIGYHVPVFLNPGMEKVSLNDTYDLFFAICGSPAELIRVAALGNWRAKSRTAVCLIDELWVKEIPGYGHYLSILEKFDLVMLYYSQTVEPLGKRLKTKCAFLPPGVDAVRFCPYPNPPRRSIDVCSIGRRSEKTHRKLLKMAAAEGMFYLHDSIAANQVLDATEHRILFSNIAKRSKYFIVNPGLIDRPDVRGNQMEIGNRYYEGAASGTIMLGERPDNPMFEKLFDWPDAVVHMPYNSAEIADIISAIQADPERQERIRRKNVREALLRHDWVYRWEAILQAVGLEPTPAMHERKKVLRSLAEIATQSETQQLHHALM
jgi:Glycosyl transferases group 1